MPNPNPEDLYDDGGGERVQEMSPQGDTKDGKTALLPKNLCPGMKPGDELTLRIVRAHDDQYEVAYDAGEEGESAGSGQSGTAGDSEMASMMED